MLPPFRIVNLNTMSKRNSSTTLQNVNNVPTNNMTNNTQTLSVTNTAISNSVKLENPNGTSHRLVVYNFPEWDAMRDLSLTDLTQAKAGLEAIGKWAAGGIGGNSHLIFVAPIEKLAAQNGTGTMAYVSGDYNPAVDGISVDIAGLSVLVTVDARDIPAKGEWRRLHLDGGQLYAKAWEHPFSVRDEDAWTYWYCRTLAVLNGKNANISISVGPKMLADAQAVEKVCNSVDPKAANAERQYIGRATSRFNAEVKNSNEVVSNEISVGVVPVASAEAITVLSVDGTPVNLATYTTTTPIYVGMVSPTGVVTELKTPYLLSANTDSARVALARVLQMANFRVILK